MPSKPVHERKTKAVAEMVRALQEEAKTGIRNTFTARNDAVGVAARGIVRDLKRAMASGGVELHYQPQLDKDGRLIGGEALLRWKYGDKYLFTPLIIRLAEESGLYRNLSEYIIRRACGDAKRILGSVSDKSLLLTVNVYADELSPEFVRRVTERLQEHGVPLRNFCLEINRAGAGVGEDIIEHAAQSGVVLTLDDFNLAAPSIRPVLDKEFSFVKLDDALVKGLAAHPKNANKIAAIAALGESLEYLVAAEYVENRDVLNKLVNLGCRVFQGWFFCPAVPIDEFIAYAVENEMILY